MHAPRSEDPEPAGGLARVTAIRSVTAAAAGRLRAKRASVVLRDDWVAHEEPLSIRVDGRPLGVVMRTPGHDLELVRGLLFAEGIVERAEDVAAIAHCRELPPRTPESWRADASDNVVLVTLARRRRAVRRRASRSTSSSCSSCPTGCGRRSSASRGPEGCTPRGSSTRAGSCWSRVKTWGATTPSTRWWARRCSIGCCRSRAASCR
jgi:hypothetical protein